MTCYTSAQLAAASGKSQRTIIHHVNQGWLTPMDKSELPAGVKGHRFSLIAAKKWLGVYSPGKRLPQ